MPTFKTIFKITNGILDIISLGTHGGMLLNGLNHEYPVVKPLQDFAKSQVNVLTAQLSQSGYGQKCLTYASGLNYGNLEFKNGEKLFTPEGIAKSGMLGLAELYLTGTHLALAYPMAKLFDGDRSLDNSSEFITAFGVIAALDIAHWATSGEESAPEHH